MIGFFAGGVGRVGWIRITREAIVAAQYAAPEEGGWVLIAAALQYRGRKAWPVWKAAWDRTRYTEEGDLKDWSAVTGHPYLGRDRPKRSTGSSPEGSESPVED